MSHYTGQSAPLDYNDNGTPVGKHLFVTIDRSTGTVAIATDENIDGISVGQSDTRGNISVASIKSVEGSYLVRVGATDLAKGAEVKADAEGKAIVVVTPGDTGIFTREAQKAGALVQVAMY